MRILSQNCECLKLCTSCRVIELQYSSQSKEGKFWWCSCLHLFTEVFLLDKLYCSWQFTKTIRLDWYQKKENARYWQLTEHIRFSGLLLQSCPRWSWGWCYEIICLLYEFHHLACAYVSFIWLLGSLRCILCFTSWATVNMLGWFYN